MVKKNKLAKNRLDKYYWQAKEQGYRSRAAFKLLQIDKKFDILGKSQSVIDLCAAPGGWTQICRKLMPVSSKVVAVDLVPITNIQGAVCIQNDIRSPSCKAAIFKALKSHKADLVLHDGAPNVGGNWEKDSFTQNDLVLCSLRIACAFLHPAGTFVTKVFRSTDYPSLLQSFRHFFKKVSSIKPHSSRENSAEIYVVCEKFNASKANLKSPMLKTEIVFQNTQETQKSEKKTLFSKEKGRNREGYEGDLITGGCITANEFLNSDQPKKTLLNVTKITFGPANTKEIPQEIKEICNDLLVANKNDLKKLLKWQKQYKKKVVLEDKEKGEEKDEKIPKDNEEEERELKGKNEAEDEEEKKSQKLLALFDKNRKQERRKKHREKIKTLKKRRANGESNLAQSSDEELFSTFRKNKVTDKTKNKDFRMDENLEKKTKLKTENESGQYYDNDDYIVQQEEYFNNLYKMEKAGEPKIENSIKSSITEENHTKAKEEMGESKAETNLKKDISKIKNAEKEKNEKEKFKIERNEKEEWFKSEIFTKFNEIFNFRKDQNQIQNKNQIEQQISSLPYRKQIKNEKNLLNREKRLAYRAEKQGNVGKGVKELELLVARREKKTAERKKKLSGSGNEENGSEDGVLRFEPQSGGSSDSSSSESPADEIRKINVFKDYEGLPKWFVDDEKAGLVAESSSQNEDVGQIKRQKKIDKKKKNKKMQEALARKKQRKRRNFEKVKVKMDTVLSSEEMTGKQKTIEVEKLKKRYLKNKKRSVVYRVTTKRGRSFKDVSGGKKVKRGRRKKAKNAKVKRVDKRMKADAVRKKSFKSKSGKKEHRGKKK